MAPHSICFTRVNIAEVICRSEEKGEGAGHRPWTQPVADTSVIRTRLEAVFDDGERFAGDAQRYSVAFDAPWDRLDLDEPRLVMFRMTLCTEEYGYSCGCFGAGRLFTTAGFDAQLHETSS
jgi:hypothetical protein